RGRAVQSRSTSRPTTRKRSPWLRESRTPTRPRAPSVAGGEMPGPPVRYPSGSGRTRAHTCDTPGAATRRLPAPRPAAAVRTDRASRSARTYVRAIPSPPAAGSRSPHGPSGAGGGSAQLFDSAGVRIVPPKNVGLPAASLHHNVERRASVGGEEHIDL